MTVIETANNSDVPDIPVEIDVPVEMETANARENLSMTVQETTTNDDNSDTSVDIDICDTYATEKLEFRDNPTSKEDETDQREEDFQSGTVDTAIEVREFPDAFYDPITSELMKDPVVIPNGNSYERSAIMEQQGDDIESCGKLYPNRALLAVINETVELSGGSLKAGMRRLSKTIQTSMKELISKDDYRPLPDVYYCSITFDLIFFPVIDPEGNTYEKVAIETWIKKNGTSPLTRAPLSKEDLYNNCAITALLNEEKGKSVENMHPSIQNFINAAPPEAPQCFPNTPEELEERRRMNESDNQNLLTIFGVMSLFLVLSAVTALFKMWIILLPLGVLFIFSFFRVSRWACGSSS